MELMQMPVDQWRSPCSPARKADGVFSPCGSAGSPSCDEQWSSDESAQLSSASSPDSLCPLGCNEMLDAADAGPHEQPARASSAAEASDLVAHLRCAGVNDARDMLRSELEAQSDLYRRVAGVQPASPQAGSTGCAEAGWRALPGCCWPGGETASHSRSLLVGWMSQLCKAAGMERETLFSATSLMDRFVLSSAEQPPESMLQLLAMAAMSVAMKFEEVNPVQGDHLLRLAVDPITGEPLYLAADLCRMEWLLLCTVDWRLRAPHVLTFVHRFLHACVSGVGVCVGFRSGSSSSGGSRAWGAALSDHALQLSELSLLHDSLLQFNPSTVALACTLLAQRAACDSGSPAAPGPCGDAWVASRVCLFAGKEVEQLAPGLAPCVEALHRLWVNDQRHLAAVF